MAEAYRVLDLPSQGQSWPEVRKAYVQKIKRLHPDVNHHKDTTAEAAQVTVAYQAILEVSFCKYWLTSQAWPAACCLRNAALTLAQQSPC